MRVEGSGGTATRTLPQRAMWAVFVGPRSARRVLGLVTDDPRRLPRPLAAHRGTAGATTESSAPCGGALAAQCVAHTNGVCVPLLQVQLIAPTLGQRVPSTPSDAGHRTRALTLGAFDVVGRLLAHTVPTPACAVGLATGWAPHPPSAGIALARRADPHPAPSTGVCVGRRQGVPLSHTLGRCGAYKPPGGGHAARPCTPGALDHS